MAVGTLLAILRLLSCRTASMGTGDVFLLLGFGLHLAVVSLLAGAASAEDDAASCNDCVNIVAFAHILCVLTSRRVDSSLLTQAPCLQADGLWVAQPAESYGL